MTGRQKPLLFDDTIDAQLEFDFLDSDFDLKKRVEYAVEQYSYRDIKKTRRLEKLGKLEGLHMKPSKKKGKR